MPNNVAWLLLTAFVASSTYLVVTQKGRRNAVLERLHISRRRVSGAKTPPRSLSPDRKNAANYADTFPPSRRFTLAKTNLPTILGKSSEELVATNAVWTQQMVPWESSYLDAEDSQYTPCEFSIQDIKALGDFPDYSLLSGVPPTNPYPDFDINKAKPRPYRPFRWPYHQTMCK